MTMPTVEDQLEELCRAVARSRAALAAGAEIDLTGLDVEVARLAEAANEISPTDREALRRSIDTLHTGLDGLEADLKRQHDAALARQAASAYRTTRGPR